MLEFQNQVGGWRHSSQQQTPKLAQVPQDVVLHHAGRRSAAAPISAGGYDVLRRPQTGRETPQGRQAQSGMISGSFTIANVIRKFAFIFISLNITSTWDFLENQL